MENKKISAVIRMILKPVALLCIRHAFSIREVLELLKSELVNTARKEWQHKGKGINISRISVMTGLQRKDVMRILSENEDYVQQNTATISSRVLARWEQDHQYLDNMGQPRILSHEGENSEFKELVARVSKDLNPGTVLAELERLGAVSRDSGKVTLVKDAHMIVNDIVEGFELLAADINDLTLAVSANLSSEVSIRHLHARTEFDNIYVVRRQAVMEWLLKQGTIFHKQVRDYLSLHDKDFSKLEGQEAGVRVAFGTYSFVDDKGDKNEKIK